MVLPISTYAVNIVKAVQEHDFTIISAEAGAGKSTQIPQYLSNHFDKVIVTNPRIIAAITLAMRVAEEIGVELGKEVGYRTGYYKNSSKETVIEYCTDGLQLIRSIFGEDLEQNRVLVIDEVHEWTNQIEALVAWTKFVAEKWNTKVVVMSATLEMDELADYFGNNTKTLTIPGSMYDVTVETRGGDDEELILAIHEQIMDGKNTLVFAPSKKKIQNIIDQLEFENAIIFPLHSDIDWEGQKKCFASYSKPKVIVATNIAQTSVTIPDIDVVVDTGKAIMPFARNGVIEYREVDVSRADIAQRMRRAGRTKEGKYILCSDTPIEWRDEYPIPEIQRSLLDQVVLQFASIGLDTAKLRFFHQPKMKSILDAKAELKAIGALDADENVTELGHKIAKMPVSTKTARMIIEAEKYGVTEEVIIIAAIIEMGSLLQKGVKYSGFTSENESDLLAELDVWNHLNSIGFIDFKLFGINKKNYFRIKEHIKKLHDALYGVVEFTSNDDRTAIIKACLTGYTSNIYFWDGGNNLYNDRGSDIKVDNKSCTFDAYENSGKVFFGNPISFPVKGRYGEEYDMNILTMVTRVDYDVIAEVFPDDVKKETKSSYDWSCDAVEVVSHRFFRNHVIKVERCIDREHPDYDRLKAEYQEEQASYHRTWGWEEPVQETRQTKVWLDGKEYDVYYDSSGKPYIYLESETVFTATKDEVLLGDGTKVRFAVLSLFGHGEKESSISALRRTYEFKYRSQCIKDKRWQYNNIKINTVSKFLSNAHMLGKVELEFHVGRVTLNVGTFYGFAHLKKGEVFLDLSSIEEEANSSTLEALQYLFMKEVQEKYRDGSFSHQSGKKKKVLTDSEKAVKEDFYSFVKECMRELTTENVTENMELIDEYYQELMGK